MPEARVSAIAAMAAITPGLAQAWQPGHASGADPGLRHPVLALPPQAPHAHPDWFDAQRHLAGVKHRYLSEATRYGLASALRCLREAPAQPAWAETSPTRRGLVLGTAVADHALRRRLDASVRTMGADALNAVSAPNISANIAAAHVAIHCQARAFSTTLTSPFLCGLEGLFLAEQALRRGRSDAVLAIATDEALPADDATPALLPGAVALHLRADTGRLGGPPPSTARIAATCWGHIGHDAWRPSPATRRFIAALPGHLGPQDWRTELVLLRHEDPQSAATATRWRTWLADIRLDFDQPGDTVIPSVGSVAPMLQAARCLSFARPALLLAIHRRRYLAFLFTPSHPTSRSHP